MKLRQLLFYNAQTQRLIHKTWKVKLFLRVQQKNLKNINDNDFLLHLFILIHEYQRDWFNTGTTEYHCDFQSIVQTFDKEAADMDCDHQQIKLSAQQTLEKIEDTVVHSVNNFRRYD
ncbi:hypothetical protein AVEN_239587-1 [Araneus ventricosus]|uniref:Uncharacterized protein n=1 Tax=Araneus ventricosus TaxID=182803 RepID=A0A4Y2LVR2_ARAVE|nr:hypothetical protein AVEN_239587-1 [Araneus ventricosus]